MENTLIWLQEMEDNNESWVNISSVITMLKKEQEEAINYTRCCEELKDKKTPTFNEWLKIWKWKQIGSSYTFKRGESYTDAESLLRSYTKEYSL
jgi:hypothetical protein